MIMIRAISKEGDRQRGEKNTLRNGTIKPKSVQINKNLDSYIFGSSALYQWMYIKQNGYAFKKGSDVKDAKKKNMMASEYIRLKLIVIFIMFWCSAVSQGSGWTVWAASSAENRLQQHLDFGGVDRT